MPQIEIDIIDLDVLNSTERNLVEEFIEGDELIFETKFENNFGEKNIGFFRDASNFTYSLNISAGSNHFSYSLNGPEIDFDEELADTIRARWTWNTTGVRPGPYEAEAVITGPDDYLAYQTVQHLAKAKKTPR